MIGRIFTIGLVLLAMGLFPVQGQENKTDVHPLLSISGTYTADWESLAKHKIPAWFQNDKIGLSMHWGPYAVPAWATRDVGIGSGSYSEWYWNQLDNPDSPTTKHHNKEWGKNFLYDQFIPLFKAENFDAEEWMRELKRNGVNYFFITSKHHDGFCLWDTKYTNRNSVKMGPKRDILKELVDAARKYEIKIGFYYSLFEWYNPVYVRELKEKTWLGEPEDQMEGIKNLEYTGLIEKDNYVDDFMVPQIVELIDLFHPDLLYLDGEWDHDESYWRGKEIAAYYYNQAEKNGQEVILNDRFGKGTRGMRGDIYHVEYHANIDKSFPWAMWRGFGKSFGHNTNEAPEAFLTPKGVVEMVVECAAENGNIEFNVGPTTDGRIDQPEWGLIQQMGTWLRINGDAIYGSKKSPIGKLDYARFTHKPADNKLFMHVFEWPDDGKLEIKDLNNSINKAYLLSDPDIKLDMESESGKIILQGPFQAPDIHVSVIVIKYEGEL